MAHPVHPARVRFSHHALIERLRQRDLTLDEVFAVVGAGRYRVIRLASKAEYYGTADDGRPLTVSVGDDGTIITVISPTKAQWEADQKRSDL